MIGLATRGYLRRLYPPDIILVGDPPSITNAVDLKPQIDDAATGPTVGAPTISNAQLLVPEMRGATSSPIPPSPSAPSVVGGGTLVPIIRRAEEE